MKILIKYILITIFILSYHCSTAQNEDSLLQAIKIYKKTGNKSAQASSYINIATIYDDKGNIELNKHKPKQDANNKQRNIILIAFIIVTILLVFLVVIYLQKAKTNKLLMNQKIEINKKNQQLNEQNKKIKVINTSLSDKQSIINEQNVELRKKLAELRKFSLAIEQSPITIVITDIDGNLEYANPYFSKLTGYSLSEVIGKNPKILKTGKTKPEVFADMWKTISSGKIWKGEFINMKKNKDEFIEKATIAPVKDENGNITNYIAVKEDITQRKKAEKELKIAKQEAENANRLKSSFLANMSHEIRTPMNAIIGFSNILLRTTKDEKHLMFVEKIAKNGENLLNLINEILDLSKIEAGELKIQKEATSLHDMINEIPFVLSETSDQKNLPINIDISKDVPKTLLVDSLRIRQVLLNLTSNALKFTDKGSISINVTTKQTLQVLDLIIEVEDTGIGIPVNQVDTIFQSFRQVEGQNMKKYGGTGLGLSITKRLVELMGGTIRVKSTINVGSTFTICLNNIDLLDIESVETTKDEEFDIIFNKSKILHVDDVEYNREIVSLFLENENIEIKEAETADQALEILETYTPDLILMDIQLPRMSGYDVTKIIRKNKKIASIPIIALTANATKGEIEKYSHVFDEYLTKPINEALFLKTISQYLKHKKEKPIQENIKIQKDFILELIKQKKEIINFPEELKNDFNENLKPIHKELLEILSIDNLKIFAGKNKENGTKYKINGLVTYGKTLLDSIDNFDLNKITELLKHFNEIINIIET